jgi:hypothetical protein
MLGTKKNNLKRHASASNELHVTFEKFLRHVIVCVCVCVCVCVYKYIYNCLVRKVIRAFLPPPSRNVSARISAKADVCECMLYRHTHVHHIYFHTYTCIHMCVCVVACVCVVCARSVKIPISQGVSWT